MQFYKVSWDLDDDKPTYWCTRALAHEHGRDNFPVGTRDALRIELVEVTANQSTVASILSGMGCAEKVLRTWMITPRGGLKEVPNGE